MLPQIDGITSRRVTYKELLKQSLQLANSLQHFGVTDADTVALVSENRLEFPVIAFATYYLGAYLATVNLTYTERNYIASLSLLPCSQSLVQLQVNWIMH